MTVTIQRQGLPNWQRSTALAHPLPSAWGQTMALMLKRLALLSPLVLNGTIAYAECTGNVVIGAVDSRVTDRDSGQGCISALIDAQPVAAIPPIPPTLARVQRLVPRYPSRAHGSNSWLLTWSSSRPAAFCYPLTPSAIT